MKKLLSVAMGLAVGLAFALPASADVDVYAQLYKDKYVYVYEDIYIYKDVDINVTVEAAPEGAAEALAVSNQTIRDAEVLGFEEQYASGNYRWNTIVDSIIGNTGITGVNQDAGNFNNQGNVFAVAVTDVEAFAHAESWAEQRVERTAEYVSEGTLELQKQNVLANSMNGNTGITSANQTVGNFNNQLNAVAVAAGLDGALVAMSEAALGQFCQSNLIDETATQKQDTIVGSLNGNHGITNFNQSAGNANNQANVVAISFTH